MWLLRERDELMTRAEVTARKQVAEERLRVLRKELLDAERDLQFINNDMDSLPGVAMQLPPDRFINTTDFVFYQPDGSGNSVASQGSG